MANKMASKLQDFYDQALMAPALLCLSCSRSQWNQRGEPCSPSLRQDCALFVNSMVNRFANDAPPPSAGRTDDRPRP